MEENLKNVLLQNKIAPQTGLADNIWQTIVRRQKYTARIKLLIFSLTGLLSLVGLIPALKTLLSDFAQSGFYEYLSLIFSNSGTVLTFWKELLLTLAESLPVLSIVSSFTLIFILLLSLKHIMRQIIKGQLSLSF